MMIDPPDPLWDLLQLAALVLGILAVPVLAIIAIVLTGWTGLAVLVLNPLTWIAVGWLVHRSYMRIHRG